MSTKTRKKELFFIENKEGHIACPSHGQKTLMKRMSGLLCAKLGVPTRKFRVF